MDTSSPNPKQSLLLNVQDDPQPFYDSIEQQEETTFVSDTNHASLYVITKHENVNERKICNIVCIILGILALITGTTVASLALIYSTDKFEAITQESKCEPTCNIQLVESIPDNLFQLVSGTNTTYNAWMEIIKNANKSLRLAFFYANLRNNAVPEARGYEGNNIYAAIVDAKKNRNLDVRIIQNKPNIGFPDNDTKSLQDQGIEVVSIDWAKAFGSGVLHTKLLIADDHTFYVGSANLDWTSLSQVKEVGVYVKNCRCLTNDITKIFSTYHYLGYNLHSDLSQFKGWPQYMHSHFNELHRFSIGDGAIFFSTSPALIGSPSRTNDIDALLHVIRNATRTVSIEVMEYLPLFQYGNPKVYWHEIETEIRSAIIRNVTVKMLISDWNHTSPTQNTILQSLEIFGRDFCQHTVVTNDGVKIMPWCTGFIHIKMMKIPDPVYEPYPFTRVNHAKFVVSDNQAYISTNNWSKDYFYDTGGISFISTGKNVVTTLQSIFDRDFDSAYSYDVQTYVE
jgi:phospholipase D3/4